LRRRAALPIAIVIQDGCVTRGLLLINVGTPDAPTPGAVRRYLRQFLGDPRVLDINPIGRALLLNLIILPTRPARSAHAYAQVWDPERGSPLRYHSQELARSVAAALGDDWRVELAMRYGAPSIATALETLIAAGIDRLIALPLFPQYASSSTGTALEELYRVSGRRRTVPPLQVVPPFWDDEGFGAAFASVARPHLAAFGADHVLMSFHGLPERHMVNGDPTGQHCLASTTCCDAMVDANRNCYRAQAFATARNLANRLGLAEGTWSTSFQSRLGRTPWIKPYTDVVLPALAARGVKRVAVMCPAFVADCLETLEEIGLRAATDWKSSGGDELRLIPSLNAEPAWVDTVVAMARRAAT
jgi:ferrochelatase